MPPAAKITVSHACPIPGHAVNPQVSGSPNTHVGFLPAGRVSDTTACGAPIAMGSPTVLINNLMAARLGDPTAHGGVLVSGHPNVLIGETGQGSTLAGASATGAPFCEECEKAKKALAEGKVPEPSAPPPDSAMITPQQAKGLNQTREEIAKRAAESNTQPDDGLNEAREDARHIVARDFFYETCPSNKLSDIEAWIDCMDLRDPVKVLTLPPDGAGALGDELVQRGFPGRGNGQFFALDSSITPEELGASTVVLVEPPPPDLPFKAERDFRTMKVTPTDTTKPVKGLMSTASPANDHWSIHSKHHPELNETIHCEGGGTQVMVPKSFHQDITTTSKNP